MEGDDEEVDIEGNRYDIEEDDGDDKILVAFLSDVVVTDEFDEDEREKKSSLLGKVGVADASDDEENGL